MITIKQWMEVCNYRITEGSDFGWHCFGHKAYRLDSWNGDQEGHTVSIVFDTETQEVYSVEAFDYKRIRAYRIINPDYKFEYNDELVNGEFEDMAWEDDAGNPVKFVDLETDEDWIEKAYAIVNDQDYDDRVQIPLTLPDDALFDLMKLAHERDVTLNQMVEALLRDAIDNEEMLKDWVGQDVRPIIQEPPFPADNFTQEEARKVVRKVRGKMKKDKK